MYKLSKAQNIMYISDFQSKLTKVNPSLYVRIHEMTRRERGLRHSGIYLKDAGKDTLENQGMLNHATDKQARYLEALNRGELDKFVCGVCIDMIPEYDVYNLDTGRIVAPGWRSILLHIAKTRAGQLDRIKKVFECSSLGESDYDNMSYVQKLRKAREE